MIRTKIKLKDKYTNAGYFYKVKQSIFSFSLLHNAK